MQSRVRTTLTLDRDVIRSIKLMALNEETTQTEIINKLLKEGIRNQERKQRDIERLRINDKLPQVETEDERTLKIEDMAGFIKIDKPVDVEKLMYQIYLDKAGA